MVSEITPRPDVQVTPHHQNGKMAAFPRACHCACATSPTHGCPKVHPTLADWPVISQIIWPGLDCPHVFYCVAMYICEIHYVIYSIYCLLFAVRYLLIAVLCTLAKSS